MVLKRIGRWFELRSARKAGESLARRLAEEEKRDWIRAKSQALATYDDPFALKSFFLGWMQGLYARKVELYSELSLDDAEIQKLWYALAITYGDRFRAEMLPEERAAEAHEILTGDEVVRIAQDIDGFVDELHRESGSRADSALDQAVRSIRAAEAAGKLAPDLRTDEELKEAIREMWMAELDRGQD